MAEENPDLLRYAHEYADQDRDLYDLLGVTALTPKEDIHRAWRKRSLKYHPDKAGDNFDAAQWELFERARDVLSDPAARARYDASAKAKLLRRQEREAMHRQDKKFADDLEAAEKHHRDQQTAAAQRQRDETEKERERLADLRRARDEERERQQRAEQDLEDMQEAKRRLRDKTERRNRKRQEKAKSKADAAHGRDRGAANGVILVPGNYLADAADGKKQYWELVCDKLRAVQAARNAAREHASDEAVRDAEKRVQMARQRIHDAEIKFHNDTAAI